MTEREVRPYGLLLKLSHWYPVGRDESRDAYRVLVEQDEGGSTLRQFEVRHPDPFLRWILSVEGAAVIESPPALLKAFRARVT